MTHLKHPGYDPVLIAVKNPSGDGIYWMSVGRCVRWSRERPSYELVKKNQPETTHGGLLPWFWGGL